MTALDNLCYHTFTNSLIKQSTRPLIIAALLADLTCLIMKKDQSLELNEMKHWKTVLDRMFHLTKEAQH